MEHGGINQIDTTDLESALRRIRAQAARENIRVTRHAQQEMVEEDILYRAPD
jgi:HJR/Mrr/RecB family endonuclease